MRVKNSERSCAISCGHRQSTEYKDSREKKTELKMKFHGNSPKTRFSYPC